MKSEQMKSNKTGSNITIRALNGHWHGSNLFSCVSTGKWEKGISHRPTRKKKMQVVILPEAQLTASTKNVRSA